MGKKNRKKKGGDYLARRAATLTLNHVTRAPIELPSIADIHSIDNTLCGLCGVDVDPYFWDDTAYTVMDCCGQLLCSDCTSQKDKEWWTSYDGATEIFRQGTSQSRLPELSKLMMRVNAPCSVCETPPARSNEEVVFRVERLAKAGHTPSQFKLVLFYRDEEYGLPRNQKKCFKWLKMAAEGGHKGALAGMGTAYYYGQGAKQSYQEARRMYELGGNNAIALACLGDLYKTGIGGVNQDRTTAMQLLRRSAEQGHPYAFFAIGAMKLEEGNCEEALETWETGARLEQHLGLYSRDVTSCQINLAKCLERMMEQDGDESRIPLILFWARRAVRNGNEEAKYFLAKMECCAHSKCQYCNMPNPQMICSKCRGVSYCDKACQKAAWRGGLKGPHKKVCNGLPVLKIYTDENCANCDKRKPEFVCQGCGKACYCDAVCQKAHFQNGDHKNECQFL